jgi:uroporphyrinogen-III decarboxylase
MGEPTGRERLLHVFRGDPVDRIPVAPFIHVNYVKEFFGSHNVDWVTRTPEVYRHFGLDLIHRNCTPAYDALGPDGPDWQREVTRYEEGRDETTVTVIRTPAGELRARESLRWIYEYDAESSLVDYPIRDEADFERIVRYQPDVGPVDVSDAVRALAAVGDEGVVAPWIQGAFNLVAFYYRKLDDLLMDAVLRPAFYSRMMDHLVTRYQGFVQQIIDAGVKVLSYAGNIANGKLTSQQFYQAHIAPYERRFIDFIQAQGTAVLYHNCGYARNLLPVYPTLGMQAYESLTPPPYGDTDLEEAVRILGPGTVLSGNIDQIGLLRTGTVDEIEAAVRQTLDTVRGRVPFILATTDYFNDGTPHDAIHALADAGLCYGRI